jgi:hypothetical protein
MVINNLWTIGNPGSSNQTALCFGSSGKESAVEKVELTTEEAINLASRMEAAAAGAESFLDIVMPNGKRLAECSGEYVTEVGRVLQNACEAVATAEAVADERLQ